MRRCTRPCNVREIFPRDPRPTNETPREGRRDDSLEPWGSEDVVSVVPSFRERVSWSDESSSCTLRQQCHIQEPARVFPNPPSRGKPACESPAIALLTADCRQELNGSLPVPEHDLRCQHGKWLAVPAWAAWSTGELSHPPDGASGRRRTPNGQ